MGRAEGVKERHTSQKLGLQVHAVEVVDSLIVVGLDLSLSEMVVSHWCSSSHYHNPAVSPP